VTLLSFPPPAPPIGKAYRGAFNATPSPTLAAHAIRAAVERSGVDPAEIEDCVIGAALQQGVQTTIGRTAGLRAGSRHRRRHVDRPPVRLRPDGDRDGGQAGDRRPHGRLRRRRRREHQPRADADMRLGPDPELLSMHNGVYMPMINTAEVVGKRYSVSRERQDAYALRSQQLTAKAQNEGRFDDEIIPVTARMAVKDKVTGEASMKEITIAKDEGNRPETTLEGLAALQPVMGQEAMITAGNASQLSDGASACVIMEAGMAAERGLKPLGRYVGMARRGHRAR
jgi:acetyl-CoA C-acetyltransferase